MRYLPHSDNEREQMLKTIGIGSVDELFSPIPKKALEQCDIDLPNHKSEFLVEQHISELANKNICATDVPFFIGAGAYHHHIPASVDHLIQRSEWLTAYTPYQPEISQGTLQALFEFQTQVATLMGMDIANASMYDGSSATAEAALMAKRITRRKKIILSGGLHPQYRDVIYTYLNNDENLITQPVCPSGQGDIISQIDEDIAAIIVQTPDFFGSLRDVKLLAKKAHEKGALLIVVITEIISLGLLEAPGNLGADIVVAEGQSLGNSLNFGGPYLGLLATRAKFTRQIPGRLCGETIDGAGRRSYTLTLSTREQHIRREKATSNICTNAGLCALAFSIHLTLLGGTGLEKLARLNHQKACELANGLKQITGVKLLNNSFFNEMVVRLAKPATEVVNSLAKKNILAGIPVKRLDPDFADAENLLLLAATELTSTQDIKSLCVALREELS